MSDVARARPAEGAPLNIRTLLFTLVIGASIACIPAASAQSAVRRDSAGIAIVLNEPPTDGVRAFLLGDVPLFQIGKSDDLDYVFDGVVAAIRLRDGRYAVADRGSGQVRIFNAQGVVDRVLGRRGNGPGEFSNLFHIWQDYGDSIRAWDGRLSTFALDSRAVRTSVTRDAPGDIAPAVGLVRGALSDGSLLTYQRRFVPVPSIERVTRDTLVVWHADREGRLTTRVGPFLASEILKGASGTMAGPSGIEQASFSIRAMPYALGTHLAAVRDALISTDSYGEFEWQVRSLDGRLQRIVRVRRPRIRITPEIVRKQQAEETLIGRHLSLSSLPVAKNLPISRYPRFIPAYSALRIDSENRVWVRQTAIETTEPERWDVFRLDGVLIGVLAMPERFTPLDAGVDYVLGVWRDELDVEYVRVYRLDSTGRP